MGFISFIFTTIGVIGTLLGIISFFLNWKALIKKINNFILAKILNRKPMLFDLRLIIKYSKEPTSKFNSELYKEIKNEFNQRNESMMKKALRPESMKILIKKNSNKINFELVIRLDEEEEEIVSLTLEESKILHYNLILKLSHPINLNWQGLKNLKDLIRYIEKIEIIIKKNIFENWNFNQRFFTCYIERQFFIKEKPLFKDDDINQIRIRKYKINITGSDLGTLEDIIAKYYLK